MTSTITLRTELHPSGSLMLHAGSIAGIRVEAHQNEQAHNARANGSWFLTIGVAGHPLRCYSQHRTPTPRIAVPACVDGVADLDALLGFAFLGGPGGCLGSAAGLSASVAPRRELVVYVLGAPGVVDRFAVSWLRGRGGLGGGLARAGRLSLFSLF